MTDSKLLQELIDKKGIKKKKIIGELGISYASYRKKAANEKPFTAEEIEIICRVLDIRSLTLKNQVFFATNVDRKSTKFDE